MYPIISKREVGLGTKEFKIEAPLIAKKWKPGQFLVIRINEKGERIPLTIVETDPQKGNLTIIFSEVGKTTKELGALEAGDSVQDVVGPLGTPSEIENFGHVVAVAGGTATAVVYPVVKALKEAGNLVTTILGFRSKVFAILTEEMKRYSDVFYLTTDDGSQGRKGLVSDVLRELVAGEGKVDRVYAIGPAVMMKAVAEVTRPAGIKTVVSVNPIMLDATGMCGVCRVRVGGEMKLGCVDGPDFDGHQVDFDLLISRLRMYSGQEKISLEKFEVDQMKRGGE
jgi:NAD(P)H-flavin reductase